MERAKVTLNFNGETNQFVAFDQNVQEKNVEMGSAIMILQQIQNKYGYVSPPMLERISLLTGIPSSVLYSIVTFYAQFRLEPIGENLIQVCHGTACHLAGAEKIGEAVQLETGAKAGHTSPDGKFTTEKVACLGCCSLGPVITINHETYGRLNPELARRLIQQRRKGGMGGEVPAIEEDSMEEATINA